MATMKGYDKMTIWVPHEMRAELLRKALDLSLQTGRQVSASGLIRQALETAGYGPAEVPKPT